MEPRAVQADPAAESEAHEDGIVAAGDEHDRGVETLCVGEAA
jgi:hypothetical protein